jgi:ribose/xylose/arabinose/galactoside ABC-type transport system permease subunit
VFFTLNNIMSILKSNTVLAVSALALTLLMLLGNVDVSTGAQISAISVIVGMLSLNEGVSLWMMGAGGRRLA